MIIENYLKILNLSYQDYFNIRFKFYKEKFGDELQEFQFINMIKYCPEEDLDNQFYHKIIRQYNPSKPASLLI